MTSTRQEIRLRLIQLTIVVLHGVEPGLTTLTDWRVESHIASSNGRHLALRSRSVLRCSLFTARREDEMNPGGLTMGFRYLADRQVLRRSCPKVPCSLLWLLPFPAEAPQPPPHFNRATSKNQELLLTCRYLCMYCTEYSPQSCTDCVFIMSCITLTPSTSL